MFKKICIKPNESTFPTDIGFIAEALLYYEKVILIASTDTFPILINNCDKDLLLELLLRGNLQILIRENMLGTMSQTLSNGNVINDVSLISSDRITAENVVFDGLFKATGRRGHSKRVTNRLMEFIKPIKYDNGICDLIRDDLDDKSFVKQSIIDTIQFYNPNLILSPSDIHYEKVKTDKGFFFATNLNFEAINKAIPNNPDGKIINSTGLILNIQETRGDMHLASSLDAEIATTPIHTHLMKLKFRDIYQKNYKSSNDLYQFNDLILNDGHAIREVINSGDREFKDLIEILDKADKFRGWLNKIEDDKDLIKEYHNAVTKETWVDKLPGKSFRWSFFTGLGLAIDAAGGAGVGTAIGLGISAGDAFLLDKVLKGWNPSVFVDKELKDLMKTK